MTAPWPATTCPSIRKPLQLAGLFALMGLLGGCANVTGSPSVTQIRIIDASPDAGGLDIYQGSGALAYNLGLGTITSYVPTAPGAYPIGVDAAGTRQQLVTATGSFAINAQYTVVVGNYLAGLQETILRDQSQPAPAGQIALRFIHQSTRGGALDFYLIPSGSNITQVRPVLTGVAFGTNTGYLNVPSGTYTFVALTAGTAPSSSAASAYSGAAVVYPGGAARTLVVIDQQVMTTPGVQVVVADDFTPATLSS